MKYETLTRFRKEIRDYLNDESKQQEVANIFGLAYCKVCGNYELYEDLERTLSDNYKCNYCENVVLKEDIVMPKFIKEEE